MPVKSYFGNTLSVHYTTTLGVDVTVAVLKGVTVREEHDRASLYGQGSIKRQAVSRANMRFPFTARYAKFSGDAMGSILGSKSTAGGTETAEIDDDTKPPLFDMVGTVTSVEGTGTFIAKLSSADMMFTLNIPEGDYVMTDLEGEAEELSLEYSTP